MITDAQFADLNQDGWLDLILLGDWMGIVTYINNHGKLIPKKLPGLENMRNWNSIRVADLNGDGFPEVLAETWDRITFLNRACVFILQTLTVTDTSIRLQPLSGEKILPHTR